MIENPDDVRNDFERRIRRLERLAGLLVFHVAMLWVIVVVLAAALHARTLK